MNEKLEITPGKTLPGTLVARVEGIMDAFTSRQVLDFGTRVCAEDRHLLLDLSGVEFLASRGLGALLALAERFNERGRTFELVACSPAVREAIKLLNLDRILTLTDREEDALRRLAA